MIAIEGMEMPEGCRKCKFWWMDFDYTRYCLLKPDRIITNPDERPDWCPLREARDDA